MWFNHPISVNCIIIVIRNHKFTSVLIVLIHICNEVGANVPGGIFSDLRNAGILNESIYYRFNDIEYKWVAMENWTYTTEFQIDEELMSKTYIALDFTGMLLLNIIAIVQRRKIAHISLNSYYSLFLNYTQKDWTR